MARSPRPEKGSFREAVHRVVSRIPPGTVLSYGRVAVLAGRPGAPRAVVQALHALEDTPWWRVARADGTFAPQVAQEQAKRLRREGAHIRGDRVAKPDDGPPRPRKPRARSP